MTPQNFLTHHHHDIGYESQTEVYETDVEYPTLKDLKDPTQKRVAPSTRLTLDLSDFSNNYSRSKYTVFALLGDFGGFNGAIVMLPAFLMSFYAPSSFQ